MSKTTKAMTSKKKKLAHTLMLPSSLLLRRNRRTMKTKLSILALQSPPSQLQEMTPKMRLPSNSQIRNQFLTLVRLRVNLLLLLPVRSKPNPKGIKPLTRFSTSSWRSAYLRNLRNRPQSKSRQLPSSAARSPNSPVVTW